jgi:hypothetical protein
MTVSLVGFEKGRRSKAADRVVTKLKPIKYIVNKKYIFLQM